MTALGVLVLVLVVWYSLDVDGTVESDTVSAKRQTPAEPVAKKTETPVKKEVIPFGGAVKSPAAKPEVKKETGPIGGPNVIVIQSIPPSRKDELNVLKDFFARKGIETEIIIDRNGYAILVTRQGFTENPESSGTEGYKLYQKIQQLGQVYPEETNDTKFGIKPFQDAYGYKR